MCIVFLIEFGTRGWVSGVQKVQERGREGRRRPAWAVGGNFMGGRGENRKQGGREGRRGREKGRERQGRKETKKIGNAQRAKGTA